MANQAEINTAPSPHRRLQSSRLNNPNNAHVHQIDDSDDDRDDNFKDNGKKKTRKQGRFPSVTPPRRLVPSIGTTKLSQRLQRSRSLSRERLGKVLPRPPTAKSFAGLRRRSSGRSRSRSSSPLSQGSEQQVRREQRKEKLFQNYTKFFTSQQRRRRQQSPRRKNDFFRSSKSDDVVSSHYQDSVASGSAVSSRSRSVVAADGPTVKGVRPSRDLESQQQSVIMPMKEPNHFFQQPHHQSQLRRQSSSSRLQELPIYNTSLEEQQQYHPFIVPPHLLIAPRADIWMLFAVLSCAATASIGQIFASSSQTIGGINNYTESAVDKFALSVCCISFAFALITAVGFRYAPLRGALTRAPGSSPNGRREQRSAGGVCALLQRFNLTPELLLLSFLALLWIVAIPIIADGSAPGSSSEVTLAVSGSDIWNANLFYSSWGSVLTCVYLLVEVATLEDRGEWCQDRPPAVTQGETTPCPNDGYSWT